MDQVTQIREKLDIISFISEYIPVKKAGKNFQALCPFHGEKTPSFNISPERQLWHCFGCGKGGDIYTFLMEYERLEFPEALKILAKKAGIELVSTSYADTVTSSKKDLLYKINSLAAEFYHYILMQHPAGKQALAYVQNRGINDKVIGTFKLGFAPVSGSSLCQYLLNKKQFKREDVFDAGLAIQGRRDVIDFFRGRLIFPLIDHHDNVVGFSGRMIDGIPATGGKYINTRDTLVYHKRDQIFGLPVTKDAIRKQNQVLLVEGEFDVMSCFQNGVSNVAAVKGTALTEQQVRLLSRYTQKITFCFDGDEAGKEAIKRSLSMVAKRGITATVVVIPSGKDPDESLRTNPVEFKEAVKHDENVYDYLFNEVLKKYDSSSSEGKQEIAASFLPFVNEIENAIVREHYMRKLSSAIQISYESISRELERLQKKLPPVTKEPIELQSKTRDEKMEEYLLALILQSSKPVEAFHQVWLVIREFLETQRASQKLFVFLQEVGVKDNELDVKTIGTRIPKELSEAYSIAILLPLPDFESEEKRKLEMQKTAYKLRALYLKEKIRKLGEEIKIVEKNASEEESITLKQTYSRLVTLLKAS